MKSSAIWTCCRLSSKTPPAGSCISVGLPREPIPRATFFCATWRRKRRLTAFSPPSGRATMTRRSRRLKPPVNILWCGSRTARERGRSIPGLSIYSSARCVLAHSVETQNFASLPLFPPPKTGGTHARHPTLCKTQARSRFESDYLPLFDRRPRLHTADTIHGLQGDKDCSTGSVSSEGTRKREDRRGHHG